MITPGEIPQKPDTAASIRKLDMYRAVLGSGNLALSHEIDGLQQNLIAGLAIVGDLETVNHLLETAGRGDLTMSRQATLSPLPSVMAAADNKQSESWPSKWKIWTTDATHEGITTPQVITSDELEGIRHDHYPESQYIGDVSGNRYFVRALILQPDIIERTVELCSSPNTIGDKLVTAPYLFAAHVLCEYLVDEKESGGNPNFLNR